MRLLMSTQQSQQRVRLRQPVPCLQRSLHCRRRARFEVQSHTCRASGERVPDAEPEGIQTEEGWIGARRRRKDWSIGPSLDLSAEDAVFMQLQVFRLPHRVSGSRR